MQFLSLNTQHGYQGLPFYEYLSKILKEGAYDTLLLQEANDVVVKKLEEYTRNSPYVLCKDTKHTPPRELVALYNTHSLEPKTLVTIEFKATQPEPAFGLHYGHFVNKKDGRPLLIGSTHFPAHLSWKLREDALLAIYSLLMEEYTKNPATTIVIGGDFNTGLPWERGRMKKFLAPDFVLKTPPDSNYNVSMIEPHGIFNTLVYAATHIGVRPRFNLDHFIVNKSASEHAAVSVVPVAVAVSDHLPLVLTL